MAIKYNEFVTHSRSKGSQRSRMTSASFSSVLGMVGTGSKAGPVYVRQGGKVKEWGAESKAMVMEF